MFAPDWAQAAHTVPRCTDSSATTFITMEVRSPDTFTDGVDVVVEGRLDRDGTFQATTLLAKCASRYENAPDQYQQTPGYQQGTSAPRA